MGAISDFVDAYDRDFDKYSAIEKRVKALCKDGLRNSSVGFLCQSRVKQSASLEKKLRDRSTKYKDEAANVANVWDLIGVRIILNRCKDIHQVETIVRETFHFVGRTQHPKDSQNMVDSETRFRGYNGLHLYVELRGHSDEQYLNPVIEIQVMTAFMWVYATLHHDVEYKKLHGEPTEELLWDIDLLRGAANIGEVAIKGYDKRFSRQRDVYSDLQTKAHSVVGEGAFDELKAQSLSVLQLTNPQHDNDRAEQPSSGQRFEESALEKHAFALLREQTRNKAAHLEGVAKARQILLQMTATSSQDRLPSIRHLRILHHLVVAERKMSLKQGLDTGEMKEHLDRAEAYMDKAVELDMWSGLVGAQEQMTFERHIVRGLKAKLDFRMHVRNEESTRRLLSDAIAGIEQALEDLEKVDVVKFEKNTKFARGWIHYFQMLHTRF